MKFGRLLKQQRINELLRNFQSAINEQFKSTFVHDVVSKVGFRQFFIHFFKQDVDVIV